MHKHIASAVFLICLEYHLNIVHLGIKAVPYLYYLLGHGAVPLVEPRCLLLRVQPRIEESVFS